MLKDLHLKYCECCALFYVLLGFLPAWQPVLSHGIGMPVIICYGTTFHMCLHTLGKRCVCYACSALCVFVAESLSHDVYVRGLILG